MFKNALIFRIVHWEQPTLPEMEERLAGLRFAECGATQPESAGWIEPRGERHGALAESVGGELMLRLAVETKAVPSAVVKRRLEEQLDKLETETGRRPKGKHAKELKEAIVHELLPRAFPKRGSTWVWIAPKAGWVVVDAASLKKADQATSLLIERLGGKLQLELLQTELSPGSAMAQWLSEREAPAGFTLDRECELKQPDSEKATVRYARHTLDIAEVGEHIRQGKLPTQVAMTWSDRVSFVLTEAMTLKKLKLLDVVLESHEASRDDSGFDTDVALVTGELSQLIPDLVRALGGELQRDRPPVAASAPAMAPPASSPEAELEAPWV